MFSLSHETLLTYGYLALAGGLAAYLGGRIGDLLLHAFNRGDAE